jgi:hypothetical protein
MYVSPSSLQSISLRPASAKKAGNQTNQQPGLSSHTGTLSQNSQVHVSRASNANIARIPLRGDTSKSCRTPPKDSKGPRQPQHRDVAGASAAFINRWSHGLGCVCTCDDHVIAHDQLKLLACALFVSR